MRPDDRSNFIWALACEGMGPTGDGDDARVRDALGEEVRDGERTDRVCVAPQQERSRPNLAQRIGHVGAVVDEPARCTRPRFEEVTTPLGSTQSCHVDSAGGGNEDQARDELGSLERQAHGENSPHRLRGNVARFGWKLLHEPPEEIVQGLDGRLDGAFTKTRIAEHEGATKVSQSLGHGPPERRTSTGARENTRGGMDRPYTGARPSSEGGP